MDTFLLRLRFRLLLLLLLLPPVAPDDCPECTGDQGEEKPCKCKLGSTLTMKAATAQSVQWTDPNGDNISSGGRYTVDATEKTLKLESVEGRDADNVYTASYTDSGSQTQKFKVKPLVVCETDNEVCNAAVGQNVRLKAGDDAHTWYFRSDSKTTTGGNLDILNLAPNDFGTYEAKASAGDTAQKTIPLALPAPKVTTTLKPGRQTTRSPALKAGRQVEVKASSGLAKMGTKWSLECVVTQNGTVITDVTVFTWLKDGINMMGKTAATVDFAALKATDAGTYVCEAGKDQSAGYDLKFNGSGAVAPSFLLLTLSLLLGLLCY